MRRVIVSRRMSLRSGASREALGRTGSGLASGGASTGGDCRRIFCSWASSVAYSGPHRQDNFSGSKYYSSLLLNIYSPAVAGALGQCGLVLEGLASGRTYPSDCGQLALELSKAAVGYLWSNGFAVVHR